MKHSLAPFSLQDKTKTIVASEQANLLTDSTEMEEIC